MSTGAYEQYTDEYLQRVEMDEQWAEYVDTNRHIIVEHLFHEIEDGYWHIQPESFSLSKEQRKALMQIARSMFDVLTEKELDSFMYDCDLMTREEFIKKGGE